MNASRAAAETETSILRVQALKAFIPIYITHNAAAQETAYVLENTSSRCRLESLASLTGF